MKYSLLYLILACFLICIPAHSQVFSEVSTVLPGVYGSGTSWGDYDNDGDLDILLTGNGISAVYRNDGGDVFSTTGISLQALRYCDAEWADYNNDGYLDITLVGEYYEGSYQKVTLLYKNNGNHTFSLQEDFLFRGGNYPSVSWVDYNNDGDHDLHVNGVVAYRDYASALYKNIDGLDFVEQTGIELPGVINGATDWADFDRDGDLDILILGEDEDRQTITVIFENKGNNTFTELVSQDIPQLENGSGVWGDYDNDGDPDLLLSGMSSSYDQVTTIVKNNGDRTFTEVQGLSFPQVYESSVAWGDYDNDGDLDALIVGDSAYVSGDYLSVSRVFRNDGGDVFTAQYQHGLTGLRWGSADWGDYDADGDLDILLTGRDSEGTSRTLVYKNNGSISNTPPGSPVGLSANVKGNQVSFSWTAPYDLQTPQSGLAYNLYMGTASGAIDVCSPHANVSTGHRTIAAGGDITRTRYFVNDLEAGHYYWSVQAVDGGLAGSAFATEGTFTINFDNSIYPIEDQYIPPHYHGTELSVHETETADSRQWMYSLSPGGPYIHELSGETGSTYGPVIDEDSIMYVVCVSTLDGVPVTSNEVRIQLFPFVEQTGITIEGLSHGSVDWGDYDNDDDLDLLICGLNSASERVSKIYDNDGHGGFVEQSSIALKGIYYGEARWVDYNNDDYLDIMLSGYDATGTALTTLYRNNTGHSFTEQTGINLGAYAYSSFDWGDYDLDGDQDLLISGRNSGNLPESRIYRNNGNNTFTSMSGITLTSVDRGDCSWEDFDEDGDLDILLIGYNASSQRVTILYENEGSNVFTNLGDAGISGIVYGTATWGDYDADGRRDLLVIGYNGTTECKLYKNTGNGTFAQQTNVKLTSAYYSDADWGDIDNDGDLDIIVSGYNSADGKGQVSEIYINKGDNQFVLQDSPTLTGVYGSSVEWADYDNDRDLDLIIAGYDGSNRITQVFENVTTTPNTPPSPPTSPSLSVNGSEVRFSWNGASDAETASNGLTYNLRIGTSPGASDIMTASSDIASGFRRLSSEGNLGSVSSYSMDGLPQNQTIYWSVQAIDHGYLASEFTQEKAFIDCFSPSGYDNVNYGVPVLGDFDRDGDLDIFGGFRIYSNRISEGLGFEIITELADTPGGDDCWAWGDYDNDGDLDLATSGPTGNGYEAYVYRNDGDTMINIEAGMVEGIWMGTLAWIDYDNDGRLDLVIYGNHENHDDGEPLGILYRNNGDDTFTNTGLDVEDARRGAVAIGDYDNDGYADILTCGYNLSENIFTSVLRNNAGASFTNINAGIQGYSYGGADWGDYDSDGDQDIFITGGLYGGYGSAQVIQNQGDGTFLDIEAGLAGDWSYNSSAHWGDIDNDGDLDVLTTLEDAIIRNDGSNSFTPLNIGFEPYAIRWGDLDNDGDLDLISNEGIFLNDLPGTNNPPDIPAGLMADVAADMAKLSWDPADDDLTPSKGLTYNVCIGSTPGGCDILSPMVANDGYTRALPARGNAMNNTFKIIRDLPVGTYYWRVQTIDNTFEASEFSEEHSFEIFSMFTNIVEEGLFDFNGSWGDYDLDGDLDVLDSYILRNDGSNSFTSVGLGLPVANELQWVDYDNDGDLDVITSDSIYRNDQNNVFTNIGISFEPSMYEFGTGDYDADGDLDIVSSSGIFRNDGADIFTRIANDVTGEFFFDYDNDGDLDILSSQSVIYRNDSNDQFTDINAGLAQVGWGAVSFADYDRDHDLDVMVVGTTDEYNYISKIYRNDGNDQFIDIQTNIRGFRNLNDRLKICWGDYNNDGFLDVIICGYNNGRTRNLLYINNLDETFTELEIPDIIEYDYLYNVADIDLDGDLDAGAEDKLFRNNNNPGLVVPSEVTQLQTDMKGLDCQFAWNRSNDSHGNGFSYNLRIGTSPGGSEIKSATSVVGFGNIVCDTSWLIHDLDPGTYYWSVQAVNQVYNTGPWAAEQSFLITDVSPDFSFDTVCQREPTTFTDLSQTTDVIVRWHWDFDDGSTSELQNPIHIFPAGGTYDVSLWAYSQSGDSAQRVYNVPVLPAPEALFSVSPVCKDQPSVLQNSSLLNGVTVASWTWDFGNGEQSSVQGTIEKVYVATDTASLTIVADNGCWDADTQQVMVVPWPNASMTLASGDNNIFCDGDSAEFNVPFNQNCTYQWTINGADIGGATGLQYIVKQNSGDYGVEVLDAIAGCLSTDQETVTVNLLPSSPSITSSSAATEFCSGDSVLFSVPFNSGYSYDWIRVGVGPVGDVDNEFYPVVSGEYEVVVTNANQCSNTSDSRSLVINDVPAIPSISLVGEDEFCDGGSALLRVSETGGLSYQWYDDGAILVDSVSNSLTVSGTGNYHIIVENEFNCTAGNVGMYPITVNPLPVATSIELVGEAAFCEDSSALLRVDQTVGYDYAWMRNGGPVGANSNELTVNQSGQYTLTFSNSYGCTSTAPAPMDIMVHSLPGTPSISLIGDAVFCSGKSALLQVTEVGGLSYQWYRNGGVLLDSVSSSITVGESGDYDIVVENEHNCFAASSGMLPITVNPVPVATSIELVGDAAFCEDSSALLRVDQTAGYDYAWMRNGGPVGANSNELTVNQSGQYALTFSNSYGCISDAPNPVDITVYNLPGTPSISLIGDGVFCAGKTAHLQVTDVGGLSYQWYRNGGVLSDSVSSSITVGESGDYDIVVENEHQCSAASSGMVPISVNPVPVATSIELVGDAAFCEDSSALLRVDQTAGYEYAWMRNAGPVGANSNELTVNQSGQYTLTFSNSNGCTSDAPDPVDITVYMLPSAPSISVLGSQEFCEGGYATLQVDQVLGLSYEWTRNGSVYGIDSNILTADSSGLYTIRVENANGCSAAASESKTIVVNDLPYASSIELVGDDVFCEGGSALLRVTDTEGYTYSWKRDDGPVGGDSNELTVTQTGLYSLSFSKDGCSSDAPGKIDIEVNSIPSTPSISVLGQPEFCLGGSATLQVDELAGLSYNWLLDGEPVGSNSVSHVVTVLSGVYDIRVENGDGCSAMAAESKTITVNAIPVVTGIDVDGGTEFCGSGSSTLSVTEEEGYEYQWTRDGGPYGSDSHELVISSTGSYTVSASSAGCTGYAPDTVDMWVLPSPDQPVVSAYPNETEFCKGESLRLSFNNLETGERCIWKDGSNEIARDVNEVTITENGSYALVIENAIGCPSLPSDARDITFNAIPPKPELSIGEDSLVSYCPEYILGILVTNYSQDWEYQWTRDGDILTMESQDLTGKQSEGVYRVKASQGVCESEERKFVLDYKSSPDKPVVYANDGPSVYYLFCDNQDAATYQWFYEGTPLGGANEYYYVANQKLGTYVLEITEVDKDCAIRSDPVTIPAGQTGTSMEHFISPVKIYPNPNNGNFTYEFKNEYQGEVELRVLSLSGKVLSYEILQKQGLVLQGEVQITQDPGAYLLLIKTDDRIYIDKVLIWN